LARRRARFTTHPGGNQGQTAIVVDARSVPTCITITPVGNGLRRTLSDPGRFCLFALGVMLLGLGLDHFTNLAWQLVLSLCTWAILVAACWPLSAEQRARTAVVIIAATIGEIIGSIILGIYTYRLGNLPMFVPPGHGLVYLTGLRLADTRWASANRERFIQLALAGIWLWGIVGLSGILGRHDVAGAVGCLTLTIFILRGRAPELYAGVFIAVAALEIYGTAIGTWFWHPSIPGLGLPNGNPPSGAASGYVLFDIAALAFGPALLRAVRRVRRPVAAIHAETERS